MSPTSPTTTLFVDGYNIIGLWSHLRQIRQRDGLESARHSLVDALVNYSAYQGFETCVVFDSQYRNSRGQRETIANHFYIHYTDFNQTADTFIERQCALRQRHAHPLGDRTIVATSDRAQQLTVVGYGAEWMSADQLDREVRRAKQQVRHRQRSSPKRSSRRFLSSRLDPAARQQLSKFLKGL
ncbi:MAG: NYN domain-containing protein [Cyanobacteria bacterium SID2]|nr:NYN domain-containing protein [Cyanobacteria bacterium SID2]MBP0004376.1 NYN domain-containing protein [Cyanobacteria bacterium SBC]